MQANHRHRNHGCPSPESEPLLSRCSSAATGPATPCCAAAAVECSLPTVLLLLPLCPLSSSCCTCGADASRCIACRSRMLALLSRPLQEQTAGRSAGFQLCAGCKLPALSKARSSFCAHCQVAQDALLTPLTQPPALPHLPLSAEPEWPRGAGSAASLPSVPAWFRAVGTLRTRRVSPATGGVWLGRAGRCQQCRQGRAPPG